MGIETSKLVKAARKASQKARQRAKKYNYKFVAFKDGVLYKSVNGKPEKIKEVSRYEELREQILNDNRIGP